LRFRILVSSLIYARESLLLSQIVGEVGLISFIVLRMRLFDIVLVVGLLFYYFLELGSDLKKHWDLLDLFLKESNPVV
jgi:hypothetical protein